MKTVAIISPNRQAYSETFIHAHFEHLPGRRLLLFGDYFPTHFCSSDDPASAQIFPEGKPSPSKFSLKKLQAKSTAQSIRDQFLAKFLIAQKVDVVLAEYGPSGVAVMYACQAAKIPLFVHFHGYDAYRQDILLEQGKSYPELFDRAKGIICVSENMRAALLKMGANPEKTHLIPYGVEPVVQLQPPVPNLIVAACRLIPKKAPLQLLKGFQIVQKACPKATLVIIGDGPMMEACVDFIREADLTSFVQLLGSQSHTITKEWIGKATVFAQHSVTASDGDREGLPLAILEAMAAGVPVVSTLHGGIPDAIRHGKEGFLVLENHIEKMADCLLTLLQNPQKRAEMSNAAHLRSNDYQQSYYLKKLGELLKP